jgi:acetoin utilization deacetylase AcuC-like enzyme
MLQTALAFDSSMLKHDPGAGHPEQPARYTAVLDRLTESGTMEHLESIGARAADDDELALVHDRKYIDLVTREVGEGREALSTGDTDISDGSLAAARVAAGAALTAVDAVFAQRVHNAFCLVRPPGHHAGRNRGMGFCLFNNVAIAAKYAQMQYGAERVLIADWDVHHGNGTQDIFYCDSSVYFFSTHQSPWYPGTGASNERGEGRGAGTTRNCPFPAGSGCKEIAGAFRGVLLAETKHFQPDFVLISAGFDSRLGDPLGLFRLRDEDFAELTKMMLEIAERTAGGRLVSLLEGGYNLSGLASAADAHVRTLASCG